MARIENLTVVPDNVARVVINERSGTIVMGEDVRISEAAVSYGGISVTVGPVKLYSEGLVAEGAGENNMRTQTSARVSRSEMGLRYVSSATRLVDVVKALNVVKASPQELIAILQAMKRVGALKAELEII